MITNDGSFMQSAIAVPAYKKLKIGNKYTLIMDDDFSIKANSKYGPLWEAQSSNLLNLLSNSAGLPSGQFALQGAQIWQSTDPITISVTASLFMNTDPYTDVIAPTMNLMAECLPRVSNDADQTLTGLIEGASNDILGIKLKSLIPPGPNLQTLMALASTGDGKGLFGKAGMKSETDARYARGLYTITLGFVRMPNTIITSVEPTFSKEVAPHGHTVTIGGKTTANTEYYPISASISFEFSSMEVATLEMLQGWGYKYKSS